MKSRQVIEYLIDVPDISNLVTSISRLLLGLWLAMGTLRIDKVGIGTTEGMPMYRDAQPRVSTWVRKYVAIFTRYDARTAAYE